MDVAESYRDYKGSPYHKHVGKSLKAAVFRHRDLVAGTSPKEKRKLLFQALLRHDQDVALAILFLLIDPTTYAPNISSQNFSDWTPIPTKLEFDHRGAFHKVVKSFWKYEGGESKSSIEGT